MATTEVQVKEALQTVIEPELGRDLVSLNMIENIEVKDEKISFTVKLTTPESKHQEEIRQNCIDAVKEQVDSDAEVEVEVSSKVPKGRPDGQGDQGQLDQVKDIIAVASGKGGVGKSAIAANLACSLAKTGAKVGLVDTDIYGPSIPTMFGLTEKPNINTQRKLIPLEKYGVKLVSMGLLVDQDQAVVWRGPMVSSAVKQFLNEVEWGELDYLIMDLPPGTGDIQLTIVQSVPLTGSVIVSTPQDVALDDARKGVAMFEKVNVPVLGIVENMAYFTPPDLPDRKYYLFGQGGARELAGKLDVPLLGEIPIEQRIREGSDKGRPIVIEDESSPASQALEQMAQQTARNLEEKRRTEQDQQQKIGVNIK